MNSNVSAALAVIIGLALFGYWIWGLSGAFWIPILVIGGFFIWAKFNKSQ